MNLDNYSYRNPKNIREEITNVLFERLQKQVAGRFDTQECRLHNGFKLIGVYCDTYNKATDSLTDCYRNLIKTIDLLRDAEDRKDHLESLEKELNEEIPGTVNLISDALTQELNNTMLHIQENTKELNRLHQREREIKATFHHCLEEVLDLAERMIEKEYVTLEHIEKYTKFHPEYDYTRERE